MQKSVQNHVYYCVYFLPRMWNLRIRTFLIVKTLNCFPLSVLKIDVHFTLKVLTLCRQILTFFFSVVYEHRSRLEKSLQKERLEHKKAKEGKYKMQFLFCIFIILLFEVSWTCFTVFLLRNFSDTPEVSFMGRRRKSSNMLRLVQ